MAQLLPFIGAGIGAFFGGPAGAQAGFMIGSLLAGALAPTQTSEGSRLSDLRIQTSTYGRAIPLVFGAARLSGNILWAPPEIREVKKTEEVSKNQEVTTYSYFGTAAIGICEGPIAGIRRVWADGKILFDASASGAAVGMITGAGGLTDYLQVYLGTEDQLPDATMQSFLGADMTPAHRGLAYVVLHDMPLEKYGNRIPAFEFEVITQAEAGNFEKLVQGGATTWATGTAYDYDRGALWSLSNDWPNSDYNVLDVTTGAVRHVKVSNALKITDNFGNWSRNGGFRPLYGIRYISGRLWASGVNDYGVQCFAEISPVNGTILSIVTPDLSDDLGAVFPVGIASFAIDDGGNIWCCGRVPEYGGGSRLVIAKVNINSGSAALVKNLSSTQLATTSQYNGNVNSVEYEPRTATVWMSYLEAAGGEGSSTYRLFGLTKGSVGLSDKPFGSGGFLVTNYNVREYPATGQGWFVTEPVSKTVWFYDGANLSRFDPSTNAPVLIASGRFGGATPDGLGNVYVVTDGPTAGVFGKLIKFGPVGQLLPETIESASAFLVGYDVFADPRRGLIVSGKAITYLHRLTTSAASQVSVSQIFQEVSRRVHVPESALNFAAAGGSDYKVQGFAVTTRTSARSALDPLRAAYALDVVESDGQVKISPRAVAPVVTRIPYGDLAAREDTGSGSEHQAPLKTVRQNEMEISSALELTFSDPSLEYRDNIGRAHISVQDSSVDVRAITLPLVMPAERAVAVAEMLLAEAHQALNSYEIQVGIKYIELDPGGVIDVESENGDIRMLVTKIQLSPSGLIRITGQGFDHSVYEKLLSVPTIGAVVVPPVKVAGTPGLLLLDIPLLSSLDNKSGFYAVSYATSNLDRFDRAQLCVSTDDITYTPIATFQGAGVIARAGDALADCPTPELWDTQSVLHVFPEAGWLYSSTDAAVLNGANAALLGGEIVQFVNAVENDDGSYTLSRFLRGRKGTEAAMSGHTGSETLILLNEGIKRVDLPLEATGVPLSYKLVGQGKDSSEITAVRFTNNDIGLECYSPVKLTGTRDAATGDLTIGWVRRTRIGGELRDKVDALLSEASEAYEIDVLDGGGAVKRTLSSTVPALTYTATMQAEDFGSSQASVGVKIYQISAAMGRGFPLTGTV